MAAEGGGEGRRLGAGAERQWGRGRMAAEGNRWKRWKAPSSARQWGRGRMAAEGQGEGLLLGVPILRQWGRGRMAAEGKCPMAKVGTGACVNGAAAGWPRKVSTRRRPAGHAARQWGRGRMAAEGSYLYGSGRVLNSASMGPRPDGRGRSSSR